MALGTHDYSIKGITDNCAFLTVASRRVYCHEKHLLNRLFL